MRRTPAVKEIFIWAFWIGLAIMFSVFLNSYVLVNAQVITGSMEGTIMTRDRVFGLRFFDTPQRGDIIVFESPLPQYFNDPFVKRVVGLPGEQIAIFSGVLHIDGVPLPESYASQSRRDFAPIIVPDGHFFVMGDNRNFSRDSREWGPIAAESIIGKIHITFSPRPVIIASHTY